MNGRIKLIAILSAGGIAGALFVILAVAAATRPALHSGQREPGSVPICTSKPAAAEPTFYSETRFAHRRMHQDMEITASGDVDRDFARMMIPHHQGSIDMALLQLKYGSDKRLRRLAQSIIIEQTQEIDYMRSLLDAPSGVTFSQPGHALKEIP